MRFALSAIRAELECWTKIQYITNMAKATTYR